MAGIANVVELFKRNEPDLASLARFRGRDRSKVNATNPARDEDFVEGQGRISERETAEAVDVGAQDSGELAFHDLA